MGLCRVLVYLTAALAAAGRIRPGGLGAARSSCSLPDRTHVRREAGEPRELRRLLAARLPERAVPLRVAVALPAAPARSSTSPLLVWVVFAVSLLVLARGAGTSGARLSA
mgnify:CR=1 FL=1